LVPHFKWSNLGFAKQMNNYEFCAQWALDQDQGKNVRVLDYGCGVGKIVQLLKNKNINAFGCDLFYGGADYLTQIDAALIDEGKIKRMEGSTIPFDSESFDLIINNQVMEHVENLDSVLTEMRRVLKPGGLVLSIFPDISVWREGHCGIPFLHWFPKNSRPKVYYAAAFRILGFGFHKGNKSVMRWSQHKCEWLDKWTHYRTRREIGLTYNKYFCDIQHIEDLRLQLRLGKLKALATWLPKSIQRLVVEKLMGLVFVARKPV
jgi:SAM-dependent methyltransferase